MAQYNVPENYTPQMVAAVPDNNWNGNGYVCRQQSFSPSISQQTYEAIMMKSALIDQQAFRNKENSVLNYQLKLEEINAQTENKLRRDAELAKQKKEEIQLKADNDLRRDEAKAQRREQLENASLYPVQDADGFIRIQKNFPDGKILFSEPILRWPYVELFRIISAESGLCVAHLVKWNTLEGSRKFILPKSEGTVLGFIKAIEAAGNPFRVGRDRKRQIGDLVFGFLLERSSNVVLPECFGWYKVNNIWKFAYEGDMTIESLFKGCD